MMWCEVWVNRSQSRFNCRKLIEERANVSSLTSVQNLKGRRLHHSQAIHALHAPARPQAVGQARVFASPMYPSQVLPALTTTAGSKLRIKAGTAMKAWGYRSNHMPIRRSKKAASVFKHDDH